MQNIMGESKATDFTGDNMVTDDDRTVFYTTDGGRWIGAANKRYKLVLSTTDNPWLFDLENDPYELYNVINQNKEIAYALTTFESLRDEKCKSPNKTEKQWNKYLGEISSRKHAYRRAQPPTKKIDPMNWPTIEPIFIWDFNNPAALAVSMPCFSSRLIIPVVSD